jgi:hypothetical protein
MTSIPAIRPIRMPPAIPRRRSTSFVRSAMPEVVQRPCQGCARHLDTTCACAAARSADPGRCRGDPGGSDPAPLSSVRRPAQRVFGIAVLALGWAAVLLIAGERPPTTGVREDMAALEEPLEPERARAALREIRAADLALRYGTDADARAHLREAESHIERLTGSGDVVEPTAVSEASAGQP